MLKDVVAAFAVTFFAELGDRSQLVLIGLSANRSRVAVAIGGFAGIAVVQGVAVLLGDWISDSGMARWIPSIVAAEFLALGAYALWSAIRSEPTDEFEERPQPVAPAPSMRSTVLSAAAVTFIAESGDKTMFTSAGLASVRPPWAVLFGSLLGFATLTILAVSVGAAVGDRLPERTLRLAGGVIFVIVGLVIVVADVR